ncbi:MULTISPECIES: GTP 3',8-cyclase MoaA [unclassified Methylophaga]|jgi:cyclic pyranopterin phosphate synthase|uniref:GTP 3',8-cyclase MoaA n=1 Tax=unclassified Methylophaga TaxID=2629249 RepID=UPI000C96A3E5|nr:MULTISPECIES: GTP 3',8-cyclase MoaA [unclassified Methylophaga]MAK65559.1 GTP 3',8-cyclase MoaA [Methylophaga sp.]MAY16283.1 GTP 3',8-cyclase MoaA [Methylophaga sp.]HAO24542.1 GTP 3',8-cyclase MoaA [Methylophaga sp.]HCD05683.1 GTP 3',8-cyclase MoaA [Methylophaga sp.]|tara:strand:+ start:1009 stop:2016 length:1008 start_codon:yes stop_codon:yes gene_type:complete
MTDKKTQLIDNFGRRVSYVRISITDRCDFRCVYCMDEEMTFMPRERLLTLEEIAFLVKAFCELGVEKVRITGGEPLVRRNVDWLIEQIGALKHTTSLKELNLTTNGSQLPKYAEKLAAAGMDRINISLDSLNAERFRELTRTGELTQVLDGIEAAKQAGFKRIKLNAVIMKGRNEDEIIDLAQFAIDNDLDISYIEEMPLGQVTHSRNESYCSSDEVLATLQKHFDLQSSIANTGGPSRYYKVAGTNSKIGFISPHSHNFCESCNRVRVTTEGRLLLCLGQEHSMDLRDIIRRHPGDIEQLKQAIIKSMDIKPKGHDFNIKEQPIIFRHMSVTGG